MNNDVNSVPFSSQDAHELQQFVFDFTEQAKDLDERLRRLEPVVNASSEPLTKKRVAPISVENSPIPIPYTPVSQNSPSDVNRTQFLPQAIAQLQQAVQELSAKVNQQEKRIKLQDERLARQDSLIGKLYDVIKKRLEPAAGASPEPLSKKQAVPIRVENSPVPVALSPAQFQPNIDAVAWLKIYFEPVLLAFARKYHEFEETDVPGTFTSSVLVSHEYKELLRVKNQIDSLTTECPLDKRSFYELRKASEIVSSLNKTYTSGSIRFSLIRVGRDGFKYSIPDIFLAICLEFRDLMRKDIYIFEPAGKPFFLESVLRKCFEQDYEVDIKLSSSTIKKYSTMMRLWDGHRYIEYDAAHPEPKRGKYVSHLEAQRQLAPQVPVQPTVILPVVYNAIEFLKTHFEPAFMAFAAKYQQFEETSVPGTFTNAVFQSPEYAALVEVKELLDKEKSEKYCRIPPIVSDDLESWRKLGDELYQASNLIDKLMKGFNPKHIYLCVAIKGRDGRDYAIPNIFLNVCINARDESFYSPSEFLNILSKCCDPNAIIEVTLPTSGVKRYGTFHHVWNTSRVKYRFLSQKNPFSSELIPGKFVSKTETTLTQPLTIHTQPVESTPARAPVAAPAQEEPAFEDLSLLLGEPPQVQEQYPNLEDIFLSLADQPEIPLECNNPSTIELAPTPVPLKNFGNTCYINATLQALLCYTGPGLTIPIIAPLQPNPRFLAYHKILTEFKEAYLIKDLDKTTAALKNVYQQLFQLNLSKEFAALEQKDAQAFLNLILDVHNYSFKMATTYSPIKEGTGIEPATKVEPMGMLTLNFPSETKSSYTLTDLIKANMAEKNTDPNDRWEYALGRYISGFQRANQLESAPPLLVVNLVRHKWDKVKQKREKIVAHIEVPDQIDLSSYSNVPAKYRLISGVNHINISDPTGMSRGHYIAWGERNGVSYQFNDETVTPGNCDGLKKDAYLLFYQKED